MKKLLLVCLAWMLCQWSWADPNTVLHDTRGRPIQLSQFKGRWVVLNYWAAWCDKCREEIPELNRFYADHQNSDIVLLGVNADYLALPELRKQIKQTGIQFPVLVEDPEMAWKLMHVTVLPTTIILNPEGKVVKTVYGANTESSLASTIESLK